MNKSKYLLALPLLMGTLVGCGNKGTNFTETTYEDAKKIADNYKESIKNSKASTITIGGHINKIAIKGDATWWSFDTPEGGGIKPTLISLIPNFSFEDGEINIDPQDMVSTTLPGSLVSVFDTFISSAKLSMKTALIVSDLPRFPMNHNLIRAIHGIKEIKVKDDYVDWDNIEDLEWKNAEIKYYTGDGRLKIDVATQDINSFMDEINLRLNPGYIPGPVGEKKYPATFSVTTNKIGYIDSLGIKFKVENIDLETPEETSEMFYAHIKGDIELDLALTFKQNISDPMSIKYQLTPYHIYDPEKDTTVDAEYGPEDGDKYKLTLEKDNIIEPTADLDDLKEYVTFDWRSNVELDNDTGTYSLKDRYDDPIFNQKYWKDNAKNIALTNESYDVVVLPTYDKDTKKPKYQILGATFDVSKMRMNSLLTTSIDGRTVSINTGWKKPEEKLLISAADEMIQDVEVYGEDGKIANVLNLDEIFINVDMLGSKQSEYIVNIPVARLPQE